MQKKKASLNNVSEDEPIEWNHKFDTVKKHWTNWNS